VGKPAEEILRVAEREHCDVIAMSTHGRTALGRGVLGSVTDKVIHSSNLPTLTITPEKAKEYSKEGVIFSKIMVPLDGSPLAETALPYVEELARGLSLEIILVRVSRLVTGIAPYFAFSAAADQLDVFAASEADDIEYLRDVAKRLKAKGLRVQWKHLRGTPTQSIVRLAQETPQDMVVLTNHGCQGRWKVYQRGGAKPYH
jgi:nucleotide-binding universal stress UspA family protein